LLKFVYHFDIWITLRWGPIYSSLA